MTTIYADDDADLGVVQQRNVAVLGHDDEVLAHALCLRDSGVDVRVGLRDDSERRDDAEGEGLRGLPPYDAAEEADLIMLLGTPAEQRAVFAEAVEANLVPGDVLVLGDGRKLAYGLLQPPAGVDVCLVASASPGAVLREKYCDGRGVPVLIAVEHDASGEAWPLALSYARAIGGTRAGAVETTFAEHAHLARFCGIVLGDELPAVATAGLELLEQHGYQPEVTRLVVGAALRQVLPALLDGQDAAARGPAPESARRHLLGVLAAVREKQPSS